jgi:3-oxoacyl-[acyl-carrier protein] reductase
MTSLSGKTAVVTGGGSGIGAGLSAEFHSEGANVVVLDIDREAAERTAAEIDRASARVLAIEADVSDTASVHRAGDEIRHRFGDVDILLSNAGVFDGFATLLETTEAVWDRVIAVDLKGAYVTAKEFLPGMIERGSGVIIATASVSSLVAGGGGPAYTSAKHGLLGFTRELAREYGSQGVRVNAILPGAIESNMSGSLDDNPRFAYVRRTIEESPAGRFGRPKEVARLAVLLASDDGAFFHGSSVVLDGGWTIS